MIRRNIIGLAARRLPRGGVDRNPGPDFWKIDSQRRLPCGGMKRNKDKKYETASRLGGFWLGRRAIKFFLE